jgi:hypothetical protein
VIQCVPGTARVGTWSPVAGNLPLPVVVAMPWSAESKKRSTVSPFENPPVPVTATVPDGGLALVEREMCPAGLAACAGRLGRTAARRMSPRRSVRARRGARGARVTSRPPCE